MERRSKKFCRFCVQGTKHIDYKDIDLLQNFVTDKGKIRTSYSSGNCAKHQRKLARAIKNARLMALLPFVSEG